MCDTQSIISSDMLHFQTFPVEDLHCNIFPHRPLLDPASQNFRLYIVPQVRTISVPCRFMSICTEQPQISQSRHSSRFLCRE
jgi:hypothetical protein